MIELIGALSLMAMGQVPPPPAVLSPPPALTKSKSQLSVSIEVLDSKPKFGDPIRVRVSVSNPGPDRTIVARARSSRFQTFGAYWHGWTLSVQGPDGEYSFAKGTEVMLGLAPNETIELDPGESFSFDLDLMTAARKEVIPLQVLGKVKGVYSIQIGYRAKIVARDNKTNLADVEFRSEKVAFELPGK